MAYALVSVANAAITASGIFLLANSYPTQIRYSGISFSYNVAFGIFAGFTPFICTYLIKVTSMTSAPALYMVAVCLLALVLSFLAGRKLSKVFK